MSLINHMSFNALPKIWEENPRVEDMVLGKRRLVIGVVNEDSIEYGCAANLRAFDTEVRLTYITDKSTKFIEPLEEQIGVSFLLPLDCSKEESD